MKKPSWWPTQEETKLDKEVRKAKLELLRQELKEARARFLRQLKEIK